MLRVKTGIYGRTTTVPLGPFYYIALRDGEAKRPDGSTLYVTAGRGSPEDATMIVVDKPVPASWTSGKPKGPASGVPRNPPNWREANAEEVSALGSRAVRILEGASSGD